ncbi:MAG: TolC family protein [Candidatus Omnitrophica bacterium]|nr:TolC family protein [Candidatus Omnitrophota bacterium]
MRKILFLFLLMFFLWNSSGFCEEPVFRGKVLKLEEVVNLALSSDPRILLVKARLDKEKALHEAVMRGFFPKLRTELYGALTSEASNRGIVYWTTEVRIPVFEGGRRLHELKAESLKIDEKQLYLAETENEIREEIKLIYIGVLKEKELLTISQNWLREVTAYFEIANKLGDAELFTEEEILHVKTMLREAQFEHLKHKEAFDYGQSLLKDILGLAPEEKIELENLDALKKPEIEKDQFIKSMKEGNSFYKILDLKVKETEEEKKILFSERFPKLSLTGRFRVARDNSIDENRFEAGILGSWNIWDFGELGSRIKAKEFEAASLKSENNFQIKNKEREAGKLISDLRVLWGKLSLKRAALDEKKKHHHGEIVRLMTGDTGKFQVIDSLIDFVKARMAVIEAASDYWILEAKLETFKGGNM